MKVIDISAADRTLFHVAASKLGDASQWWRIAQFNMIADPDVSHLPKPVPVILPPADPNRKTGLPAGADDDGP